MQYGNYEISKIETENIGGLNRTMQYGNSIIHEHSYNTNKFKSYYVVWKPTEILV